MMFHFLHPFSSFLFSVCFCVLAYSSVTHASPGTSTAVGSHVKYLCHLSVCVCVSGPLPESGLCVYLVTPTLGGLRTPSNSVFSSHLFIIHSSPLSLFSVLICSRGGKQRMNESHYLSRPSCRSLLHDKLKPVMITGGAN